MKNLTTGGAFMKSVGILLSCLVVFTAGLYAQEELAIQDIIDMAHAGLSDSFILQKIRISTLEYEPSVEDLVELRRAGVSERIILALMGVTSPTRLTSQVRYYAERAPYAKFELFGGYSRGLLEGSVDLNGWNVTTSGNVNRWFGFTFDGSGYYRQGLSDSLYTALAGPQFAVRVIPRVTPFVRALGGVAHVRGNLLGVLGGSETGVAYGGGGGVDVLVTGQLTVRAAQVDFIRLRILGVGSDHVRASFGIVGTW